MTVGNKKTEAYFIANTEFSWGKFHLYTLTNKTKKAFYKKMSSRKCRYRSPPEFKKCKTELVHVANFGRLLQNFGREDVSGRRSVN